jgi:hypothetical protein
VAKARVGLDGLRFHDLRHTAVALAIAQGAHPKAIQARMGHSSVQVTLDRYGHLFRELDADIAEGLDKTFRASLILLPGGLSDTSEDKRRTQKGQRKGVWIQTSVGGTPKSAPDLDFSTEAARRIELLYRALQSRIFRTSDPHKSWSDPSYLTPGSDVGAEWEPTPVTVGQKLYKLPGVR